MAKVGDRVRYWTPDTGPDGKTGTIRFVEPVEKWPDVVYAQIAPDDGASPLILFDRAVWGFDVIEQAAQQLDLFADAESGGNL